MGRKQSLYKANRDKIDEYFTLYADVANEVVLYTDQLKGKRIICPCDWDESYNEEIVYKEEGYVASSCWQEYQAPQGFQQSWRCKTTC